MQKRRFIRLAIAQINSCVGDFSGNSEKIISCLGRSVQSGCDIVIFPELAVCGYPPEDLLFKKNFIAQNQRQIDLIKKHTSGITAIVGFASKVKGKLYNSAAMLSGGKVLDVYHKMHLPNYGVFDEKRYFSAGTSFCLYRIIDRYFAINICEDIWVDDGLVARQAKAGASLVININASPYHINKIYQRQKMIKAQARKHRIFVAYANLIGGQDELVFDGQSMLISSRARVLFTAPAFEEDLSFIDIDLDALPKKKYSKGVKIISLGLKDKELHPLSKAPKPQKLNVTDEVFKALVLGTKDYFLKNGFSKAVLGLSGGIDSALVAVVAKEALGSQNVLGVALPSQFNAPESLEDAKSLAMNLGINYKEISIQEIFESYLKTLEPHFQGQSWSVAEENIQARIRGNILMGLSNKFGWLVLTTGNKSEMSVGYATLYGDMAGGFAVIKDVPKTLVYKLAQYYNESRYRQIIPQRVIEKAPSAELRPNQKDTDTLPAYEELDPVIKYYVEDDMPVSEIIKKGFSKDVVLKAAKMVDRSEYKRRQSPPGIKITPRAFGRDRRMPITNRFYE
ncbi:MAG: NAD+ synthase [Candidatus Omnitrophica bacterium]|nr:NAD+ synthase [Candidatus Omnitrophota bacterium]